MRVRVVLLFALSSALFSCGGDEEDLGLPTRYGLLNSLDYSVTVDWNGDPESATLLAPEYFTFVGSVRGSGGQTPGPDQTPLWCLRIRTAGGGGILFYGTDIPRSSYVHMDQGSGGSNIYLVDITEQFLDIPQSPTNCMSPSTEEI